MPHLNRRLMLALPLMLAPVVTSALATETTYRGWTIDASLMKAGVDEATLTSLKTQIDLVESIDFDSSIKDFFRAQILMLDPSLNQPGRVGPRGLFLKPEVQPPENPVLLHELIHVYHFKRLEDGKNNTDIIDFYEAAKQGGFYPPKAYALTNVAEFFAMTASVVLWGKAARPPFMRAKVLKDQPDLYAWIVKEFDLKIVS
jgi:hypothetical protein